MYEYSWNTADLAALNNNQSNESLTAIVQILNIENHNWLVITCIMICKYYIIHKAHCYFLFLIYFVVIFILIIIVGEGVPCPININVLLQYSPFSLSPRLILKKMKRKKSLSPSTTIKKNHCPIHHNIRNPNKKMVLNVFNLELCVWLSTVKNLINEISWCESKW